jgi:putative transposase
VNRDGLKPIDTFRREAGVRPSMGTVADCYDNAMCESFKSFFATLECELLAKRRFRNQAEARMAVFDFIESWYNSRRLHSDARLPLADRL